MVTMTERDADFEINLEDSAPEPEGELPLVLGQEAPIRFMTLIERLGYKRPIKSRLAQLALPNLAGSNLTELDLILPEMIDAYPYHLFAMPAIDCDVLKPHLPLVSELVGYEGLVKEHQESYSQMIFEQSSLEVDLNKLSMSESGQNQVIDLNAISVKRKRMVSGIWMLVGKTARFRWGGPAPAIPKDNRPTHLIETLSFACCHYDQSDWQSIAIFLSGVRPQIPVESRGRKRMFEAAGAYLCRSSKIDERTGRNPWNLVPIFSRAAVSVDLVVLYTPDVKLS